MNKVIRIGTIPTYARPAVSIFAQITYNGTRLSISGVIGPRSNGDAAGSAGQVIMSFREYDARGYQSINDISPAPGWTRDTVKQFFDIWQRWHLNDMRAGSAAQETWLRANPIPAAEYAYPKSHYEAASAKLAAAGLNPDADGYAYGSAWKFESVPEDVITFLQSLPDTDIQPAWV